MLMRFAGVVLLAILAASCSGKNDWKPPVLPDEGRKAIEKEMGQGASIAMLPTGKEAESRGWLCGMASGADTKSVGGDRSRLFIFDTVSGELHVMSDASREHSAMQLMDDVEFFETFKACRSD